METGFSLGEEQKTINAMREYIRAMREYMSQIIAVLSI